MEPDGHTRLIHALAVIESAYRQALQHREAIQATAGTMLDDWNKKAADPHDPQLRDHLLERRHAALLAGGNHGDD